eukprot:2164661-Amphidinium_carterae.2
MKRDFTHKCEARDGTASNLDVLLVVLAAVGLGHALSHDSAFSNGEVLEHREGQYSCPNPSGLRDEVAALLPALCLINYPLLSHKAHMHNSSIIQLINIAHI